jgi:hypothetical protein
MEVDAGAGATGRPSSAAGGALGSTRPRVPDSRGRRRKTKPANRLAVHPGLACSADQLTIVFVVVFVLLAAPYVFDVSVLNFGPYMFDWPE